MKIQIQILRPRSIYWHGMSPICELLYYHREAFGMQDRFAKMDLADETTLPWWMKTTDCTALVKQGCVALVKWKGEEIPNGG
jgi:hypothetical protein